MRHFRGAFVVAVAGLAGAGCWGYRQGGAQGAGAALAIAAVLAVMEVSLSFDNAVVNASVLKSWAPFWKSLFLGVGILVAVFGMRLLFPLVIVAVSSGLDLPAVWQMALHDPAQYARQLGEHHVEVAAFGGTFLMLVFLNFLFDADKERHWLGSVERRLGEIGRISSCAVVLTLAVLLNSLLLLPRERWLDVLVPGLWGVLIYAGVNALADVLDGDEGSAGAGSALGGGIGAFLYLELLDASFSFDGVIGAFAITDDIVIIMLGLAIGAMFVRSLTLYLVDRGTLDQFVYLEHGAHYAIGALAVIMLAGVRFRVPELLTGAIGVAFIAASLWSSVRHRRAHGGEAPADRATSTD